MLVRRVRPRQLSRRVAVTIANVSGAVAITATAVLGSVAMTSGPARALGPPPSATPVTTYTVNCPVLLATVPVTVNFFGRAPGATRPGAPVVLSGVRITVSLPANVVNLSIQELGFTSLGAQITADNINATNTTEGTVNATPTPVNFTVNLVPNQPFVFQVLRTPATVGPWTAGRSGTIAFTPGDLDLTLIAPGGLTDSSRCTPATTPTLGTAVIR
jgi:hypothetical protein